MSTSSISFPSGTGPDHPSTSAPPPSTQQTGSSQDSAARQHLRPVHLLFSDYAQNYPVICVWGLARLGSLADSRPSNFENRYVDVVEAITKLNRAVQSVHTEIRVTRVLNSLKWYRHKIRLMWYHEKKKKEEEVGEVGNRSKGLKEGGVGGVGRVEVEGEIAIKERNHVDKEKGDG